MDYLYLKDGRLRVWETFRDILPQELFNYWTEPARLERWWPPEAATDPIPGGHTLTATFSEVVPGQRLAFNRHPGRLVVVDFERRDEDTLLTVTDGPYGEDEAERERRLERWQQLFGRLEAARRQP